MLIKINHNFIYQSLTQKIMNDRGRIGKKLCLDTQLLILKRIIEDELSVKACSEEVKVSNSSVYRCSVNFTPPPRGGGSIFEKKIFLKKFENQPLSLNIKEIKHNFFSQLSADFCLLQYLRFYFLQLLINRAYIL